MGSKTVDQERRQADKAICKYRPGCNCLLSFLSLKKGGQHNMKKTYSEPQVEVIVVDDVIVTSPTCDDQLPPITT
jgi:hypothetical protein